MSSKGSADTANPPGTSAVLDFKQMIKDSLAEVLQELLRFPFGQGPETCKFAGSVAWIATWEGRG